MSLSPRSHRSFVASLETFRRREVGFCGLSARLDRVSAVPSSNA